MSDVNWHRTFAVSSLVMAIILIGGSLYLHIQQKHHYGRLRLETTRQQLNTAPPAVDAVEMHSADLYTSSVAAMTASIRKIAAPYSASIEDASSQEQLTEVDSATLEGSQHAMSAASAASPHAMTTSALTRNDKAIDAAVPSFSSSADNRFTDIAATAAYLSDVCLQCICETASGCQPVMCGADVPCGLFRIYRPYWLDAGKPRIQTDNDAAGVNNTNRQTNTTESWAYSQCVNNFSCATRTVSAYVKKFARDCNHDGVIDCRDHVALHMLGPTGCLLHELQPIFATRMASCLAKYL